MKGHIDMLIILLPMTVFLIYFLVSGLYMPGFFDRMPKNDECSYEVCVISLHVFKGDEEVYRSKPIKGILRAYIKARLVALYFDLFVIPNYGHRGVNYGLRKVEL